MRDRVALARAAGSIFASGLMLLARVRCRRLGWRPFTVQSHDRQLLDYIGRERSTRLDCFDQGLRNASADAETDVVRWCLLEFSCPRSTRSCSPTRGSASRDRLTRRQGYRSSRALPL